MVLRVRTKILPTKYEYSPDDISTKMRNAFGKFTHIACTVYRSNMRSVAYIDKMV